MKTRLLIIIGIIAILVGSSIVVFSQQTEIECLKLYKDIREISRTDGMILAEREIIDMHKSLVFEYVENNCPDFSDLEFIYNNYNQNILEPDLELSVGGKINFGKSFTIHAWLPTYENQNDVQYMVSVLDPEGNQVDSTIWFAKQDFVYLFDTTHPAYNITKSVTYSIQVEKTEKLQRTGIIYKSLQLDVIYPIQKNQNEN